jgi:hypothetical protein
MIKKCIVISKNSKKRIDAAKMNHSQNTIQGGIAHHASPP